jgi:hypothetical protein
MKFLQPFFVRQVRLLWLPGSVMRNTLFHLRVGYSAASRCKERREHGSGLNTVHLGKTQLHSICSYLTIVVMAFLSWKFIPVYVAASRFKMDVYEATRDGATTRSPAESIRNRITWSAKYLDVPLRSEDIHVDVDSRSRLVTSRATYVVPVDLVITKMELKFRALSSEFPTLSAADFKEPGGPEASSAGAPSSASSGPAVPADWDKNPPASNNSQSAR